MRSEDLKGQREALTEDVEGSGGESDAKAADASDSKTTMAKKKSQMLRDSAMPAIMISVLLVTFGALAATAIFVVTRAFGDAELPQLVSNNASRA